MEEFLEDINNMLNSGEVPNLFAPDEYEQLIAKTRPKAKEHGISEGDRYEICILYSSFFNLSLMIEMGFLTTLLAVFKRDYTL